MPFSSNGIDQRKADLRLRSNGALGSDSYSFSGLTSVNPATIGSAVNIVFIGQSTNNNSINASLTPFSLVNPNKVYMGNIANPAAETILFRAKEPLLCSDLVSGHHGMNLADALVTDGAVASVVLWMISFGGSAFANWCPGGGLEGASTVTPDAVSWRIGEAARCIANAGLDVNRTIIDHQAGEWPTDNATTQTNATNSLNGIINECKRTGLLRTGNVMFMHLNTRISGLTASRNAVRAAEAAVCDAVLVRQGADIDTLAASPNRYDGTHFNTTGAAAQAALKKPFYENFLANG